MSLATTATAISRIRTSPLRKAGSSSMLLKFSRPTTRVLTIPKTPPTRSLVKPTQIPLTIG